MLKDAKKKKGANTTSKKIELKERKLNIPPTSPLIALALEEQDSSNVFNDGELVGASVGMLKKTSSHHESIVSGSKGKVSASAIKRTGS